MLSATPALADNSADKFLKDESVNLVKCKDSRKFNKQKGKEIKALQRRLQNYPKESAVAEALNKSIQRTEQRFNEIAESGRYCEDTGLPVYLSDPGLQFQTGRTTDIFLPSIAFVYLNGWLFHQGRKYLQWIRATSKDAQQARNRELITGWDWPMALYFLVTGWAWPVDVFNEIRAGKLREDPKYISDQPL